MSGAQATEFSPQKKETLQEDSYFTARVQRCNDTGLVSMMVVFALGIIYFDALGKDAPEIFNYAIAHSGMSCTIFLCNPSWWGYLNELSSEHQALYLEFAMDKPFAYGQEDRSYAKAIDYDQTFYISAQAENFQAGDYSPRTELLRHVERNRTIHCPANSNACDVITLFAASHLDYSGYHLQVELEHPYRAAGLVDASGHATSAARDIAADLAEQASDVAAGVQVPADVLARIAASQSNELSMFIPHSVSGEFVLKYVNPRFTLFEFTIKYTLSIVSIIVAGMFIGGLRKKLAPRFWSFEQKWVAVLSCFPVGFNDPLFFFEIHAPSLMWTSLWTVLMVTFLCLLLLFWLSTFDVIARVGNSFERSQHLDFGFWSPKVGLLSCVWFLSTCVYISARAQESADPSYYAIDEWENYSLAKVAFQFTLWVYAAWISVLVFVMLWNVATGKETPRTHAKFMFGITMIAMITSVFGISKGAYSPQILHADDFTTYVGATNLYVWILCFAYYPLDEEAEREIQDNRTSEAAFRAGDAAPNANAGSGAGAAASANPTVVRVELPSLSDAAAAPVGTAVETPGRDGSTNGSDVSVSTSAGESEAK
jgi:hypothetical protein